MKNPTGPDMGTIFTLSCNLSMPFATPSHGIPTAKQQHQQQQARHLFCGQLWCCSNAPTSNKQQETCNLQLSSQPAIQQASQLGALIYQSQTIIILLKSANLICFSMLLDKLLPMLLFLLQLQDGEVLLGCRSRCCWGALLKTVRNGKWERQINCQYAEATMY